MKFEWKIIILSFLLSFVYMGLFIYGCSFTEKKLYVYQVGIYKQLENKDAKLAELKELGIDGYCYEKDGQYYVLSMISDQKEDVEKHANEVKGIMKTYRVSYNTTNDMLLKSLSDGDVSD